MSTRLWTEYRMAQAAAAIPPDAAFQEILDQAEMEVASERRCKNGEERTWVTTKWRAEATAPSQPYNQRQEAVTDARVALLGSLQKDALELYKEACADYVEQWERVVVAGKFAPPLFSGLSLVQTNLAVVPFSPHMVVKSLLCVTRVQIQEVESE